MTRFEDKSFSVPMPGEAAKQWPKCDAVHPRDRGVICQREFGHKGAHMFGEPFTTVGGVMYPPVTWPLEWE